MLIKQIPIYEFWKYQSNDVLLFTGVGVVLASYTLGRDAQRHNGMSDVDLIDECVKSLAKIYKYSYDKVNKLLLKGVVKRWDLDENALGGFVMFNHFQVRHYFIIRVTYFSTILLNICSYFVVAIYFVTRSSLEYFFQKHKWLMPITVNLIKEKTLPCQKTLNFFENILVSLSLYLR